MPYRPLSLILPACAQGDSPCLRGRSPRDEARPPGGRQASPTVRQSAAPRREITRGSGAVTSPPGWLSCGWATSPRCEARLPRGGLRHPATRQARFRSRKLPSPQRQVTQGLGEIASPWAMSPGVAERYPARRSAPLAARRVSSEARGVAPATVGSPRHEVRLPGGQVTLSKGPRGAHGAFRTDNNGRRRAGSPGRLRPGGSSARVWRGSQSRVPPANPMPAVVELPSCPRS